MANPQPRPLSCPCPRAVTPDFGGLLKREYHLEGRFRNAHSRLRAHAESVAFFGGGEKEGECLREREGRVGGARGGAGWACASVKGCRLRGSRSGVAGLSAAPSALLTTHPPYPLQAPRLVLRSTG